MSDRSTGRAPSRVIAVLGPTNTGKTHFAVERMLGHGSGMIGLPLRLLAREIYDRIVKLKGPREVALITGEEKIIPQRASYFVCTVEAMPLAREVDFLAVDEIQLCADPSRGHVFTHRLLHARGRFETQFLGAATMAPLIRRLVPDAEFVSRERFSSLSYAGSKKLTRLPRRSAVVAFSAENVYAIAELIRRQRGGAAVVMGSLSPRTRNAQVALYQSGEVDFLVATDAIGMGLNMDVDHVAFAGLSKFDGKRTRALYAQEIGQIAGRAGRFRRDGTFGVTGEAVELDEDLTAQIEAHRYAPVETANWRSAALDFDNLTDLQRSLAQAPGREGLRLAEQGLDETTLHRLAEDEMVTRRAKDRANLMRLWEACQTPDFRKVSFEEHVGLVRTVFQHLTGARRRLPEDWIAEQHKALDRTEGEIDVLAARLASARTLAYAANRPDWLIDPAHWQGRLRELEENLSDTLHERLMQRFIDRRTSVLLRSLHAQAEVGAAVAADGAVLVEGCYVGHLRGLAFEPAKGSTALEDKALRSAAQRAVTPEVARRLGKLAAEPDEAFRLLPDGMVLWRGEAAGRLAGGRPFAPEVRLFGDLGPEPARARVKQRLEAFLAAEASRRLAPLRALDEAVATGVLKGLARGIAYRLVESGGVIARREVVEEAQRLSLAERRALKSLGLRFGAFSLFLPALQSDEARQLLAAYARIEAPDWRPPIDRLSPLPAETPPPRALAAYGLLACGSLVAPVEALEKLDTALRAAPTLNGGSLFTHDAREALGWNEADARTVLKALDFVPVHKPKPGEPTAWRRRARKKPTATETAPQPAHSPFAALAKLKPQPQPRPAEAARPSRRRRPRRKKPAAAS
jgi:ATP-dependent RNA helicase SUPV3L1/SUV3